MCVSKWMQVGPLLSPHTKCMFIFLNSFFAWPACMCVLLCTRCQWNSKITHEWPQNKKQKHLIDYLDRSQLCEMRLSYRDAVLHNYFLLYTINPENFLIQLSHKLALSHRPNLRPSLDFCCSEDKCTPQLHQRQLSLKSSKKWSIWNFWEFIVSGWFDSSSSSYSSTIRACWWLTRAHILRTYARNESVAECGNDKTFVDDGMDLHLNLLANWATRAFPHGQFI